MFAPENESSVVHAYKEASYCPSVCGLLYILRKKLNQPVYVFISSNKESIGVRCIDRNTSLACFIFIVLKGTYPAHDSLG